MNVKVNYFCSCGSSIFVGTGSMEAAQKIIDIFVSGHSGEGHKPCDRKTCLKARKGREMIESYQLPKNPEFK